MKVRNSILSLSVAAVAVAALWGGSAQAQSFESATVTASSVVPAQLCRFSSNSAGLQLGHGGGSNIDPLSTQPATGSTVVTYACGVQQPVEFSCLSSSGTPSCSTVWSGSGVPATSFQMARPEGETMAASMQLNGSGPGQGASVPRDATILGSIQPAAFSNVPAGSYTGSVTFGIR